MSKKLNELRAQRGTLTDELVTLAESKDFKADVFAQKGFYGASLEEIAEAAGFTRGAIYSNFGSKDELLLAVIDHFIDVQIEALSGLIQREPGADQDDRRQVPG